jgi:hypothetical protein
MGSDARSSVTSSPLGGVQPGAPFPLALRSFLGLHLDTCPARASTPGAAGPNGGGEAPEREAKVADEGDEQARRRFNDKIVAKINDDPDFLGHLMENPEEALVRAGFAEAVEELDQPGAGDEDVAGHGYYPRRSHYGTCIWKRYPYRYHLH